MTKEEIQSFRLILEKLIEKSKKDFEESLNLKGLDPSSDSHHLYSIYRTTEEVLTTLKKLKSS